MTLRKCRTILIRVTAAFGIALLVMLVWGVALEPRLILDERTFDVVLPNLPPALDGARVAAIADIQIGMWLANRAMVRRAVQRVVDLRPDVVVIAGDFVYDWSHDDAADSGDDLQEDIRERADDIRDVADMLAPMAAAGLPVLAVLGNHDYGMMWPTSRPLPHVAEALTSALAEAGIQVLRNQAHRVEIARDDARHSLFIVGIDAHAPDRDDVPAALATVPIGAPRIALMHHPDSFAAFPAGAAPMAIAGHTHGGQVRLPFLPRWSWLMLAKDEPVHADGWIAGFGGPGNRLYVNRGIGFSTVPVRINCPPELTVVTLRAR